jgi:hypothetical protein
MGKYSSTVKGLECLGQEFELHCDCILPIPPSPPVSVLCPSGVAPLRLLART